MAKRKTKKGNVLFGFFSKKKKGRRSKKKDHSVSSGLKVVAGIALVTIFIAGGAVGLIYMDRHVKATIPAKEAFGPLAYVKLPVWVNQEWKDSIYKVVGDGPFPLNEGSAKKIAQKLETISWLSNVKTLVTPEYIRIEPDYRRPVGLVDLGKNKKYYLDAQMVVLDYIPLDTLPLIEIKGTASPPRSIPVPGATWAAEDTQAAVELLDMLYKMDVHFQQKELIQKPLLDEIESIDVSNFAARKNNKHPHIVLNVKDGTTKINWGAAWGQASRYLEQDEKEKLASLYEHFRTYNNSLQGTAKWIELRQL